MFKTYVADDREFFLMDGMKKDFPFPESLLRILYLDVLEFDQLVKHMAKAIETYYRSHDENLLLEVEAGLEELSKFHVYFEYLRYDWLQKLDTARRWQEGDGDLMDILPRKELTRTVSYVAHAQQQIKALFAAVLDRDGPREALEQYCAKSDRLTYEFRPLTVKYELTEEGKFSDVLYPGSIYDLIDFSLCTCIKRGIQMRVCKNCGRYFALTGKSSAEYCTLTLDEKGRNCKDTGAMRKYTAAKKSNEIFNEYRREYKRRFAWIKSGRLDSASFYAWSAEARQKEAECERGEISFEKFKWWLEHSI